jgi:hypothetical protein
VDLPDDFSGPQVHMMYVIASDGVDERLDLNRTPSKNIHNSVDAFQHWLSIQTGGRQLRVDTYRGALDITFYRMKLTDAQIANFRPGGGSPGGGIYVRDAIEAELNTAGFARPGKIYAVYYGGSSQYACGGGAWPPTLPGHVAALYLRGTPKSAPACNSNPLGASPTTPGYWEFAMIHEILHTLGYVPNCAPHSTKDGHVSDSQTDLMYAGPLPWQPRDLDFGHDDYYAHASNGCQDLATDAYLR